MNAHASQSPERAIHKAPWDEETVKRLNLAQKNTAMHPYTCGSGNRTDEKHRDGAGVLVATKDGWACPFCDYRQDWY